MTNDKCLESYLNEILGAKSGEAIGIFKNAFKSTHGLASLCDYTKALSNVIGRKEIESSIGIMMALMYNE